MAKHGKRFRKASEGVDRDNLYSLEEAIEKIATRLAPLQESWAETRDRIDPAWVEKIEGKMAEVRATLGELIEAENHLLGEISGKRDKVTDQIGKIGRAKKLPGVYRPKTEPKSQVDEVH